jgi:DNA-binding NarL/FixJ family response regulator
VSGISGAPLARSLPLAAALALANASASAGDTIGPRVISDSNCFMSTRRPTVLIADDHVIVTEGLVSLLKDNGFDVVDAVSDGHALMAAAKRLRPDVIVTDLSMPELSGLEVLSRLKSEQISSRVIVLTMHSDATLATRAMRAGASGFLLKFAAGEELLTAIEQVLAGHTYLTPALTREVIAQMSSPQDDTAPRLTPRQLEVLRLIIAGRRMKEVAAVLNLSTRTVETHKYQMMEVLGVATTAELVTYAIKHRLVAD